MLTAMSTNQCFMRRFIYSLALSFLYAFHILAQSISLSSTGLTVLLNDIPYYVSPYSVGNITFNSTALSGCVSINGFYPVTVLKDTVSSNDLSALFQNFTSTDDVFQAAFVQGKSGSTPSPSFDNIQGSSFDVMPFR